MQGNTAIGVKMEKKGKSNGLKFSLTLDQRKKSNFNLKIFYWSMSLFQCTVVYITSLYLHVYIFWFHPTYQSELAT